MTAVTLQNIQKQYGKNGHLAVDSVQLAIPNGEVTALLGPSGCGKTTTLKMIAGLLNPTDGQILFDGESVVDVPAEKRGAVMVFQNHLLFPHMNVIDNVAFGLRMQKVSKEIRYAKAMEMLELVQLSGLDKRKPEQLSGGQRQRVALARALVVEPKVLLLDEPLSNLDAHLRDEMRSLILQIQQKTGVTTIVVTHDQEEAVVLASNIALMFDGRLVQYAPPREFYTKPATKQVATFFGGSNFLTGIYQGDGHLSTPEMSVQVTNTDLSSNTSYTVTIRPEEIIVGDGNENVIHTQVSEIIYMGNHTRIETTHPETGMRLMVHTSADMAEKYHTGDSIFLQLPVEKLWVLK